MLINSLQKKTVDSIDVWFDWSFVHVSLNIAALSFNRWKSIFALAVDVSSSLNTINDWGLRSVSCCAIKKGIFMWVSLKSKNWFNFNFYLAVRILINNPRPRMKVNIDISRPRHDNNIYACDNSVKSSVNILFLISRARRIWYRRLCAFSLPQINLITSDRGRKEGGY